MLKQKSEERMNMKKKHIGSNFDDFLKEEGQLKYSLGVQLEHYQEMGVNSPFSFLSLK